MKRIITASAMLGLASCSGLTPVPPGDIAGCTAALLAAGTISPAVLLATAATSPACLALGADVINAIVQDVTAKQMARGIRR